MRAVAVRIAVVAVIVLGAVPLSAQEHASKPEIRLLTTIEGISEYQLSNGLQVLLFPDRSRPTVTVSVTIFVGSRHEGAGEGGMAHLLEHMLFRGTPTHPKIDKLFQEHGARANGTTWVDRTNYYETMVADDRNLKFGIRLEADRMINSFIKQEDLDSEMSVVRNEFERGENSPYNVLSERVTSAAYLWHNYGKSTIGNRSDIERVPATRLKVFYKKFYQPDNAMLVVAGRFEEKKALDYILQYFGAIPRPTRELVPTYTVEPAQDGERNVVLRRVGEVGLVGAVYHIPAGPHSEFAAARVLTHALTAEPSGRLYKALVESKLASDITGYAAAWHDPGLLEIVAEVPETDKLDKVRETLLSVVEQVAEKGVTAEEVDRAKRQFQKRRALAMSDSGRLAIRLSDWAAQGDWRLFFLYRDRMEKVTPELVQQVAAKYLRRSNRTVGLFIPTKEPQRVPIPETPDARDMLREYKGREEVVSGEQFDSSPANVESRTQREKLSGGLKVALLPKRTRGESVNLSLTLRYGNLEDLKGMQPAAYMLPQLMTRGTKTLTRQQLQDALDKNRAQLRAAGQTGTASFSLQTKREYLPKVLELLRDILRNPALSEGEFEIIRRQRLALVDQRKNDPQYLANREFGRLFSPYTKDDARYVPTFAEAAERYKNVTVDDLKRLYAKYLSGAHGELAIVGDFDPGDISSLLNETFGTWSADTPYKRLTQVAFTDVKGTRKTINTPDKANAAYFAGHVLPILDTHPDYAALIMGNYIFGGGSASRLFNRVREKEGLSYGVYSHLSADAQDKYGRFMVMAISNPQNMEKAAVAIREELDKILREGVTEEELKRAKQGFLQRQKVGRTSDSSLAGILSSTLEADRTMQRYTDLERDVSKLTPRQIVTALRKHIDPQRLIVVTAGDFKKATAKKPEKTEKQQSTD